MVDRMIVGIAGKKYHGKDTAAAGLEGFEVVKFAGALKHMLRAYLDYVGVEFTVINRMIEGDLKEEPTLFLAGKTPRHAMQTLGTEWGRDLIGPDFWVNSFRLRAAMFDRVVCTDMRFPNEVEAIKSMGGITIRVVRPALAASAEGSEHPSETLIATLPVDYEVLNVQSPRELQNTIREIVRGEMKG